MRNQSSHKAVSILGVLACSYFLTACGGGSKTHETTEKGHYQPQAGASWQWQLTGTINQEYSVDIYDIDLFDTSSELISELHMSGHHVICYFSAGSYEPWRPDADQFEPADLGYPMDGWPDERWLDIRSNKVTQLMQSRLELASSKGCDGVEPDNVDGYANDSGFNLTAADQLTFNRFLATQAHRLGLAIGLKNDLEQVNDLVSYFDFAVNEQCTEFNECELLLPFIEANKPVLSAEYNSTYVNSASARKALCDTMNNLAFSTLILSEDLDDSIHFNCQAP
jgi:hypothetical protein